MYNAGNAFVSLILVSDPDRQTLPGLFPKLCVRGVGVVLVLVWCWCGVGVVLAWCCCGGRGGCGVVLVW